MSHQKHCHEAIAALSSSLNTVDTRPTQTRIRLRIPKQHYQEPVLSHLISDYGVTINILAALLGSNGREDGWFDLELRGAHNEIQNALVYLHELNLEIWYDTLTEPDGW